MSVATALVECRLLDGPNLYFPVPAAKVTVDVSRLAALDSSAAAAFAAGLGLTDSSPGAAKSQFRQRFLARLTNELANEVLVRCGQAPVVQVRSGPHPAELIIAYPWDAAGPAEVLAAQLGELLGATTPAPDHAHWAAAVAAQVSTAPPGAAPHLLRPEVPVVAITGTNGKTTTSRMLGHIALNAGLVVGWSSTDGIYHNGKLLVAGDYSGPTGAARVLAIPGLQLAVTETARGGILRRGVGTATNAVSVVTNVSADHLGLGGIDSLDQLAEVKSVITKITKASGWCVLNANDPRVFAMRHETPAQVWAFSPDPDSPNLRAAITAGGRATTVLDGWVTVLSGAGTTTPVVPVAEIPMTLAGLSRVNVENALAAASAALALDLSVEQVAAGLRSFDPGVANPGRMNVWTLPLADGECATVVIDLAHNEAGLVGLIEIMKGLRSHPGRLLLSIGTAGDRDDEMISQLGELAAVHAAVVEIAHKSAFLRGRSAAEMERLLAAGARRAGGEIAAIHADEVAGIASLTARAQPHDVLAMMTHQDRDEVDQLLTAWGATRDRPADLRAKVAAAQAQLTEADPAGT